MEILNQKPEAMLDQESHGCFVACNHARRCLMPLGRGGAAASLVPLPGNTRERVGFGVEDLDDTMHLSGPDSFAITPSCNVLNEPERSFTRYRRFMTDLL